MPTYEYECEACGHEFELFQSIVDKPLKRCPKCRKLKVRRLIGTGAGFIFKGSGFYQTDYRSESYKKQMKEEKRVAGADTKKEGAKTGSSGKTEGTAEKSSSAKKE